MKIFSFLNLLPFLGFCFAKGFFDPPVLLTLEQNKIFEEFKKIVRPIIKPGTITHDISQDNLYFVKWLEAWHWDINKTANAFESHLEWREKEAMDKIDEEDWRAFKINYPVFIGGHDKLGRPLAEVWLADWNIRRAVIAGERLRLSRWLIRTFEIQQRNLYKARREGVNVTQAVLMFDLEQFSVATHMCGSCFYIYETMGRTWEAHYPYLYAWALSINSTPHFQMAVAMLKPAMHSASSNSVQAFTAKNTWLPALDKTIDKDQRSERFGGTLVRDI